MEQSIIDKGLKAAETAISEQNYIWSRYSGDKPDVAKGAMRALKLMANAKNDWQPINIMSIGSGAEPQFRLLTATNYKRILLLDSETDALSMLNERIGRQFYQNVHTRLENYEAFLDLEYTRLFLRTQFGNEKIDAIFLHHSLYYLPMTRWMNLIGNLYNELLADKGVIHCVLMARNSDNPLTSTWIYNNYALRFFSHVNDQGLLALRDQIEKDNSLTGAILSNYTSEIKFFVDDFDKFMQVIWMILLYPNVHDYTPKQREIITMDIYESFFKKKQPLLQSQDHLFIQKLPMISNLG